MLAVRHLTKRYPKFSIEDVSFDLPAGRIMGFIGRNGAGKTTTLKSLIHLNQPDSGEIKIFGKDIRTHESEIKQQIGYISGAFSYYPRKKLGDIASIYGRFYRDWQYDRFLSYCKIFSLDVNKRVRELSEGMKVKFSLALALSHNAKLLILDEPTSGLDPIARDDLLDNFRQIVENDDCSILFSTHITSDLEKNADYILFIRNGKIVTQSPKDDLLDSHALICGGLKDLTDELKSRGISFKTHGLGFSGLIRRENLRSSDVVQSEKPSLEDIMIYYDREAAFHENINL